VGGRGQSSRGVGERVLHLKLGGWWLFWSQSGGIEGVKPDEDSGCGGCRARAGLVHRGVRDGGKLESACCGWRLGWGQLLWGVGGG